MTPKKFAFRIKEKDYLLLKKKATRANITMTDFIIKAITEQKIVVIDSLVPLLSELKAVGRNLNQLTVLANTGRINVVNLSETLDKCTEIHAVLYEMLERRRWK